MHTMDDTSTGFGQRAWIKFLYVQIIELQMCV